MINYIKELFKYHELLFMIVKRDIKIKYKQSVMGFLWAILMPILIISAGMLVKYAMAVVSGKPMELSDIASVSVKALLWSLSVGSIRFATNSLMGNSNLVAKIYFPKEIFPIAAVISNLFDFIIAAAALRVILVIVQIGWSYQLLWLPILMAILILLLIGCGMLLSAFSLFFRDVKYIVDVFLTFGIFFTPVFYDVNMFGKFSNILLLNPLAPILESVNACIVYHKAPDVYWLTYSTVISCLIFVIGYPVFKKMEPAFAESI